MCDGSIQVFGPDTDPIAWYDMGTRNGTLAYSAR
jgi:hypothetical protein